MKILCLLFACLALPAHARIDLNAVLEASRSHNLPLLARMSEAALGDPLEMYPRYQWLTAQITTLPEADANNFLARYPDTPLAERFRAEWLKELGHRQSWASYAAEYPKLENPNNELQCFFAQAGMALGTEQALNAVRAIWFSGQAQPQACGPVFDALQAQGKLTSDDVWQRLRLVLFNDNIDLAVSIATRIDSASAINYKQLSILRTQPEKGWPQPAESRAGRELALYSLGRIARNTPERAAQLLSEVEAHWPEPDRQYAWRLIGVQAAKKHNPQANDWLARGGREGMDAESRAWSIRAGLRAGDWKGVLERIDTLPEQQRQEPCWRYWRARALKELGRITEANPLLADIANGGDFYSLLAREDLGTVLEPASIQYQASEDEIRAVQQWPAVKRAQALFQQNWRTEAVREWNWGMRGQTDQMLLAASEFARRQGWYDRAIYSAERTRELHNASLRYLTPYREVVEKLARTEGLDPAWVYGLMRQESRFIADAKSSAGARGLMQLMPATAKWIAGKLGIKRFNPNDALDIRTNVMLGSRYLREIWSGLNESQVMASAGYNAGPNRARAWQATQPLDASIYIETIPFSETRDYVKKVMTNAVHYSQVFGSGQTSLKSRLGKIPAKAGNDSDNPE
ncbi:MAG: transglycosylase SLT domain-containing protein [Formivibrio sp.]|nr:transglycosylase SLT domain-containing protein [Formivibrio sp.]